MDQIESNIKPDKGRRFTIFSKILFGFGAIFLITLILVFANFFFVLKLESLSGMLPSRTDQSEITSELIRMIDDIEFNLDKYLISGSNNNIENIRLYLDEFEIDMRELANIEDDEFDDESKKDDEFENSDIEEKDDIIIDNINLEIASLKETLLLLSLDSGNTVTYNLYSSINSLSGDLAEFQNNINDELLYISDRQKKLIETIKTLNLLFSLLMLSLGFILAYLIAKSISQPIINLRDVAEIISSGKIDTSVKIDSNDEVGDLATSFERMRRVIRGNEINLQKLVEKRTEELESSKKDLVKKNGELETFNKMAIGREMKMVELKKEIEQLKGKAGIKEKKDIVSTKEKKVDDNVSQ